MSDHISELLNQTTDLNTTTMKNAPLPFGFVAHDFAEKLPRMEGKSRKITLDSIADKGVMKAIVMHKGKVADGLNRIILAHEAGKTKDEIPQREFGSLPSDGTDLLDFIYRENVAHRHIAEGHLSLIAATMAKEIAARMKEEKAANPPKVSEEAQNNKGTGDGSTIPLPKERASHVARKEAAEKVGVSEDSVKKAQLVAKYPELEEAVAKKKMTLNAAYEEAVRIRNEAKETENMHKRKAERAECLAKIEKALGAESSLLAAIKRGSVLQGPDNHKNLQMFAELPKADMIKLTPLIIQKISVKDAIRIASETPGFDTTILAAINFAIVQGAGVKKAEVEFKVGKGDMAWTVTLTPSKEALAKLKA